MKKLLVLIPVMLLIAGCSSSKKSHSPYADTFDDVAKTQQELVAQAGDRVFFAYDSSAISDEAKDVLAVHAEWLKANEDVKVIVEGHCDQRGTREYNLALGERRGNAARQHLISLGVADNRITVVSYGKEYPAVVGSNEWAWNQNRRAVIVIEK